MELTVIVKLGTTAEQHAKLLQTMRTFNAACDHIASVAFRLRTANKVRVQRECYREVRERFGLSAQMTIRAIAKVCEAYKRDKRIKPTFRKMGGMVYDQRIMSWKGLDKVSLLMLGGREIIPIRIGEYQEGRLKNHIRGQVDLIYRKGNFYLAVVVDAPEADEFDAVGALGVDLGLNNLAVDSDGDSYSGKDVDTVRVKTDRLKASLQRKGTKSAKRHLRKLSGRENRFRRNTNHIIYIISKRLVAKAKDTRRAIALEDLEGIRGRTTVRKAQRRRHMSWSFFQLRFFIEYKAKLSGVPVQAVNPEYTSQMCPICGCVSRENRPFRAWFQCVTCGFAGSADHIAAINIAARATVKVPIAAGLVSHHAEPLSSCKPPILMGGT